MFEYVIFFFFAAVAVIFALVVITNRNPVVSALSLVVSFFALAVMYVLLDAPFLAALQVIVYAGAIRFAIGVCGVLTRKNGITIFMSIELMVNAVNLTFLAYARQFHQLHGLIFVFFVMAIAAAEAAVGLAIFISLFHHRETIDVDEANLMHW